MFVSSDPANGSIGLSPNGSRFSVNLDDQGIRVPKNAKWCDIAMEQANIWWTIFNINEGVNDKIYTSFGTVTIPAGIYDISTLQAVLRRLFADNDEWITLIPDYATGKVIIQLKYAASTIDFEIARTDTFRDLLGFDPQTITASAEDHLQYGENVGGFSNITSLLVHSDLSRDGIPINNLASSIIGQVDIDVKIGSLINSNPRNPAHANADNLIGQTRTTFKVWLTNQADQVVNTGGEYWSCRFVIRYFV
jgi:hypothetical protein